MKNKLKIIRAQKGLTQEQLAEMAGMSRPTLSLIEEGKSEPDSGTIIKLVKALEIGAEKIFPEFFAPEIADGKVISKRSMIINERDALLIVRALSEYSIQNLMTHNMFGNWCDKNHLRKLTRQYSEVAEILAENNGEYFICRYLSDINKEEEENKK